MVMSMYEEAISILKKIEKLGFEAYIVGGYPRDKYMKKESFDIDLCSNIKEQILKENFNITKYNNYASYVIDDKFELTLFRKDSYKKPRYPKITLINDLKEDLLRRDFTINTLCIDSNGKYIDLLGAKSDIENKIIKTVKSADISFNEDPLRIIRALRFKIDLGFELSNEIIKSINNNKNNLKNINKLLIYREIDKIKNNKNDIYNYIGDEYERKDS